MLNLFQLLINSMSYETLNRVQGDKKAIATQSLGGERKGEGRFGYWVLFRACLPAAGREFGDWDFNH